MQYLAGVWVILVGISLLTIVARGRPALQRMHERYAILALLAASALLVIAMVTHDPVQILGIEVPMEIQWLASLLVTLFGVWRFYLDPLKDRVVRTEQEVRALTTSIDGMRDDLRIVKEHLLQA